MAPLKFRGLAPSIMYALLALAVVVPWLRPGYIFALDMVFTPDLRMPEAVTSSYLFHAFLHVLNFVLPSDIIQKLLLFGMFFLAGLGAHKLTRFLAAGRVGAYFAGLLYAANPFTYDRLMTGQYSVLLGYALLPFFARSLLTFLQKPSLHGGISTVLWATLIGVISIHTLGPVAVLTIIAGVVWLAKNRHDQSWKGAFWRWSGAALGGFVVLNCYWLLPLLFGKGKTAEQIAGFTSGDAAAFATVGSSFVEKMTNVLSLRGFWAESRDLYLQPVQQVGAWGIVLLLLWLLVVAGAISLWRQKHHAATTIFGLAIVAGSLLAVGPAFMQHLPLLAGFREPQKFASLVALGFAVFAAIGTTRLVRFVKNEFDSATAAAIAAGIVLLIPVILASTIFWGARGQLMTRTYPPEWSAINNKLNADPDRFYTLFLPWHLYMRFGFADRVIAHPGPDFFDKSVIVSDQSEFGNVAPVRPTSITGKLNQLLPRGATDRTFAKRLAELNIKYIILAREEDYQKYDYLRRVPGLKHIAQQGTLELFRNELHGGSR